LAGDRDPLLRLLERAHAWPRPRPWQSTKARALDAVVYVGG